MIKEKGQNSPSPANNTIAQSVFWSGEYIISREEIRGTATRYVK